MKGKSGNKYGQIFLAGMLAVALMLSGCGTRQPIDDPNEGTNKTGEPAETKNVLAETDLSDISEMLSVYYTNRYVNEPSGLRKPGEYPFTVYTDDSGYWVMLDEPYTDGGEVKQYLHQYSVWKDSNDYWRLYDYGNFEDKGNQLEAVGEGTFTVTDTDKPVYEDFQKKDEKLQLIWRKVTESFYLMGDPLEGEHEIGFWAENFTKHDAMYNIIRGLDGKIKNGNIAFAKDESVCDLGLSMDDAPADWDALNEGQYVLKMTGTLNTVVTDKGKTLLETPGREQQLYKLCSKLLGYVMDTYQEKTGTMAGTLKGKLYITGFDLESQAGLRSEVWLMLNEGEPVKLNVTIGNINVGDCAADAECTVDEKAAFTDEVKAEAFATVEYELAVAAD